MTASSKTTTAFKAGDIVKIHSLQSEGGRKLNGKKAIIIAQVKDDQGLPRFQVKVKGSQPVNSTSAVKPANLEFVARQSLPEAGSRPRGYMEDAASTSEKCQIAAELLVMHHEGYDPPKTQLAGLPAMAFSELGQYNFTSFAAVQMEWVAGTYAMAELIRKEGAKACEDVVFALLEGDPMYLDTLIITMTNTPFIGPEDQAKEKLLLFHEYKDARTQLTPDQEDAAYIKSLKIGPLFILQSASNYKFGTALFAALRKSPVFALLIHRMMRIVAREGLGFDDGQELGPMCRALLPLLCDGTHMPRTFQEMLEKGPLKHDDATKLLDHASDFDDITNFPGAFKTTVAALSHGTKVSSYLAMLNKRKK